ncbi:Histidine kinase CKI1 [Striga hermonthica]|uniref:histidine kinase n=1 Tax=Striga hermonthica TaxID=68872 RepID=A0A9N7MG51_STRHE|nr:Histidine kinase CKI1 [Striga hermonthica]
MQMIVVLTAAGLLIPFWIKKVTRIEDEVKSIAHDTNRELISGIRRASSLLSPINSPAINLARILSSSLDVDKLTFSVIESKVASSLFQYLSAVPYMSQISYIGLDGLFFAYYSETDRLYALYSNSTQNGTNINTWYVQPANRDTGKLYGEATKSPLSRLVDSSWFQEALNRSNGYSLAGTGWGSSRVTMFVSIVGMRGRKGAISIGYPMKFLTEFLANEISLYNGNLYLATDNGNVLSEGSIPNMRMIVLSSNQVSFHLFGQDEETVISGVGNITCRSDNDTSGEEDSVLSIRGKRYTVHCSPVEIAGLRLVYALVVPQNRFLSLVHSNIRLAFVLLMLMIGFMVIVMCGLLYVTFEAAKREMYLCGALINQMEATQQSERKSMNKSLAFARASHDIRASLAGITGLIEICRDEITKKDTPLSGIFTNLRQMEACTRDLLGILNSILDTSKIESGKMQLEEEEFDVEQLLEDVVDLFHPLGTKKGVDVILDPHDGSVMKAPCVKGDRGKLKQILSNLLSNALKFTSEGHVVVRAWAQKPGLGNASGQNNTMSCSLVLCWLFEIEKSYESDTSASIQRDSKRVEFFFEVIDTGKGIPKEKQKSIFENYIQIKETALEQQGTGLGLGIVQSLVRLMGGEIGIVDKEIGEKGTCFRFNVFFSTCEASNAKSLDIEASDCSYFSSETFQHYSGHTTRFLSPKTEGSQVLLFIKSTERCKVIKRFMQRLGIKAHVISHQEHLSPALKRIKRKLSLSSHSSSGNSRADWPGSHTSSTRSKEVPLSTLEGVDGPNDINLTHERPGLRARFSSFVLVVIDSRAGPFREISRAVAEFRRDLSGSSCCSRVIWLDRPGSESGSSLQGLDEDKLPPSDLVISKPLHGSRLYRVIGLLPEFGGEDFPLSIGRVEGSAFCEASEKSFMCRESKIEEVGGPDGKRPLTGKKILIVDDDSIGRKVATFVVSQLGAHVVTTCENGEEAWRLVREKLEDGAKDGGGDSYDSVPFDCIIMDCEMPMMNGVEATRRIRDVEGVYSVRMPIMALTAHDKGEEIEKMVQAGADGYLTKPLNRDNFLKAMFEIKGKR